MKKNMIPQALEGRTEVVEDEALILTSQYVQGRGVYSDHRHTKAASPLKKRLGLHLTVTPMKGLRVMLRKPRRLIIKGEAGA